MTVPDELFHQQYPATSDGVIRFIGDLEAFGEQQQWNMAQYNHWALVAEEVVTNIAKYAYPQPADDQTFSVRILQRAQTVRMEFTDQGIPYNPLDQKAPSTEIESIEDMPIGGLGVYLVKQMSDHIEYQRNDGKNWLCVEKQLSLS